MSDVNKTFGFRARPSEKSISTKKSPTRTNLISLKELHRMENSFKMTGVYVENENMLDGYKRLCLAKICLPTLY